MKPKLSIRLKFLGLTTALLAFCILVYLSVATTAIRKDKTNLVFDYNRKLVETLAGEIEVSLQSASDKMKLIAYLYGASRGKADALLVNQLVGTQSEIFWIAKSDDYKKVGAKVFFNEDYLETYATSPESLQQALSESIPFEQIQKFGEAVFELNIEGMPPVLGFGKSVIFESTKGSEFRQFALISLLKTDSWLSEINSSRRNEIFVTNKVGEVLLANANLAEQKELMAAAFSSSKGQSLGTHVQELEFGGEKYLSGASMAFKDQIRVISLVSEAKAFSVVDKLIRRTLHISVILAFLAFFAAYFFSKSLTKPIEVLVSGMKRVAIGHLDTKIEVSSQDEISLLAGSFNRMIAELKESREQLEEINKDLELKVKERTLQLEKQNQAVKSAQEALLRTTRLAAVGEIAGRAAHEVLNPLTSILSRIQKVKARLEKTGNTELELLGEISGAWKNDVNEGGFDQLVQNWTKPSEVLDSQSLFDEDISNLDQVRSNLAGEWHSLMQDTQFLLRESERINRIVQSMRGLSIVKSDRKNTSLLGLLQNAVDVMADYASKDEVIIHLKEVDENLLVSVDDDEFLQSMTNLIRNSVQAIAEKRGGSGDQFQGEIEIEVSQDNERALIKVSDNGCGISAEDQPKLFESQFSTKSRKEGTGLGLNISRRFVRAVGGDIELIHSQKGAGTTFAIHLPLAGVDSKERISA